jgi:hypothetical protein
VLVALAIGIFTVIVPLEVIGLPEIFTSDPVVPADSPIEVTVPLVLEVPAPIADRKSDAVNADIVLSALILGNVTAEGFVRVKKLSPTVVAPRLVLAAAAVVAPVPPLAIGRVPVIPVVRGNPVALDREGLDVAVPSAIKN